MIFKLQEKLKLQGRLKSRNKIRFNLLLKRLKLLQKMT
jgi:hypothetical protein